MQWFSSSHKVEPGALLCGDKLVLDGKLLMSAAEVPIRGRHNIENVLAASIAAARAGWAIARSPSVPPRRATWRCRTIASARGTSRRQVGRTN